jgi:hypothetical protein
MNQELRRKKERIKEGTITRPIPETGERIEEKLIRKPGRQEIHRGSRIADFEEQLSHRGPKVFGDTNYREREE